MNLKAFLKNEYNLEVISCNAMSGYASSNYKIETLEGKKYVLKLHKNEHNIFERLEAEHRILSILRKSFPNSKIVQNVLKNKNEATILSFKENGFAYARVISYLEGIFYAKNKQKYNLVADLGYKLAQLNNLLLNFRNAYIETNRHEWDLQNALWSKTHLSAIKDGNKRKLAHHFFLQFQEKVLSEIPQLRHATLHGDINDWNILCKEDKITGIIDFGDTCYSPLINEIAIALAYILMNKSNPLEWAFHFLEAYHKVLPLKEKELHLLYWLIPTRLAVSVCQSAYNVQQNPNNPDNEYIQISEKPAWNLLEKWIEINPICAENYFRKACGFEPLKPPNIEVETKQRWQYLGAAYSLTFKQAIKMEQSAFQYMYAQNGITYLDCYNNIPQVGHAHPAVVEAGQKQMAKLNTNSRYLYDIMHQYSEKLLSKFPNKLNKIFYTTSGSEATDLAIRIAQTYTQKQKILVMQNGYHGHTNMGIDISDYKFSGKGGNGQKNHILKAEMPDTLRGKYAFDDENAGKYYAQQVIDLIHTNQANISSFICEPIIGCGGQVCLPPNYWQYIYKAIRDQGGVCISDEVQVGFGRMGRTFWGFELHNVVPDIVTIGKPMGNGHPMGAVITTTEIANAFANGMEYFSSFGGNPVSCAIGKAVLEVIELDNLQENSLKVGNYFKQELKKIQPKYKQIGDIRGEGLFLGIEIVTNKETFKQNTALAKQIKERLKESGILVGTDGPKNSVIKIKPPLCFTYANVDRFVSCLDNILKNELA